MTETRDFLTRENMISRLNFLIHSATAVAEADKLVMTVFGGDTTLSETPCIDNLLGGYIDIVYDCLIGSVQNDFLLESDEAYEFFSETIYDLSHGHPVRLFGDKTIENAVDLYDIFNDTEFMIREFVQKEEEL